MFPLRGARSIAWFLVAILLCVALAPGTDGLVAAVLVPLALFWSVPTLARLTRSRERDSEQPLSFLSLSESRAPPCVLD